jgi:hypothetical protein
MDPGSFQRVAHALPPNAGIVVFSPGQDQIGPEANNQTSQHFPAGTRAFPRALQEDEFRTESI